MLTHPGFIQPSQWADKPHDYKSRKSPGVTGGRD